MKAHLISISLLGICLVMVQDTYAQQPPDDTVNQKIAVYMKMKPPVRQKRPASDTATPNRVVRADNAVLRNVAGQLKQQNIYLNVDAVALIRDLNPDLDSTHPAGKPLILPEAAVISVDLQDTFNRQLNIARAVDPALNNRFLRQARLFHLLYVRFPRTFSGDTLNQLTPPVYFRRVYDSLTKLKRLVIDSAAASVQTIKKAQVQYLYSELTHLNPLLDSAIRSRYLSPHGQEALSAIMEDLFEAAGLPIAIMKLKPVYLHGIGGFHAESSEGALSSGEESFFSGAGGLSDPPVSYLVNIYRRGQSGLPVLEEKKYSIWYGGWANQYRLRENCDTAQLGYQRPTELASPTMLPLGRGNYQLILIDYRKGEVFSYPTPINRKNEVNTDAAGNRTLYIYID